MEKKTSCQMALDEVQVWSTLLNGSAREIERYLSVLSPDEVARAERFYFARDRRYFIIGRGLLRTLLGCYLEDHPSHLQFGYDVHGKPFLERVSKDRVLQFNISHSNGLVVLAFSWNRRVGIDVEYIHRMENEDKFARQFFSSHESELITSLSNEKKSRTFFRIWTCKEAFLKACGAGLTIPINEVEIDLLDGDRAQLMMIEGNQELASGWSLQLFEPAPEYQASLAVEGRGWRPVFKNWESYF